MGSNFAEVRKRERDRERERERERENIKRTPKRHKRTLREAACLVARWESGGWRLLDGMRVKSQYPNPILTRERTDERKSHPRARSRCTNAYHLLCSALLLPCPFYDGQHVIPPGFNVRSVCLIHGCIPI